MTMFLLLPHPVATLIGFGLNPSLILVIFILACLAKWNCLLLYSYRFGKLRAERHGRG